MPPEIITYTLAFPRQAYGEMQEAANARNWTVGQLVHAALTIGFRVEHAERHGHRFAMRDPMTGRFEELDAIAGDPPREEGDPMQQPHQERIERVGPQLPPFIHFGESNFWANIAEIVTFTNGGKFPTVTLTRGKPRRITEREYDALVAIIMMIQSPPQPIRVK
jgi:hypothetical protein